jgi:hypothetical protein
MDAEDASADCAICYAYRLGPAEGQMAAGGEEGGCGLTSNQFLRQALMEAANRALAAVLPASPLYVMGPSVLAG